ncbi:MAG: 4Fe-4S ferredoxin [Leptolyngbya sp. SIO4C1]|nr:4Fe-4S ferredoxin [Leptolyngbya sp. SIO4C1]
MTTFYDPSLSLQQGHWFKLICGASNQHLPAVRSLALVYTLAGADCIDVAADPAVLAAAKSGIAAAQAATPIRSPAQRPWLMASFNDGEDPHFRKAAFSTAACPADCSRPCEAVCPAAAIAFDLPDGSGVITERCYGCGRCLPVCPPRLIEARAFSTQAAALAPQLIGQIDAIEIHTQVDRDRDFAQLWQQLLPYLPKLKLIAVSCSVAAGLVDYLRRLYAIMQPLPVPLIWQTDGRPMSGDIGAGTTHLAIRAGQQVLSAGLPGYVQLAGGTNAYTVEKLEALNLLRTAPGTPSVAGIAYGSYARKLIAPFLLAEPLEQHPQLLQQAVQAAQRLVSQLKAPQPRAILGT